MRARNVLNRPAFRQQKPRLLLACGIRQLVRSRQAPQATAAD
jgi:hypothetical protein